MRRWLTVLGCCTPVAACAALTGADDLRVASGQGPDLESPLPFPGLPDGAPSSSGTIDTVPAADAADPRIFPGTDGSDTVEAPINYARLGTATATSTYSAGYEAANAIDGSITTSWYAATGSCAALPAGNDYECSKPPTSVTVALDAAHAIGRLKVLGNRDAAGYDVLTARIELLDGAGAVVHTADLATTRGDEPNGDVDLLLRPEKPGVEFVRVVVMTGEASGPGIAEIEAWSK